MRAHIKHVIHLLPIHYNEIGGGKSVHFIFSSILILAFWGASLGSCINYVPGVDERDTRAASDSTSRDSADIHTSIADWEYGGSGTGTGHRN